MVREGTGAREGAEVVRLAFVDEAACGALRLDRHATDRVNGEPISRLLTKAERGKELVFASRVAILWADHAAGLVSSMSSGAEEAAPISPGASLSALLAAA
jgi:hypothetical protein